MAKANKEIEPELIEEVVEDLKNTDVVFTSNVKLGHTVYEIGDLAKVTEEEYEILVAAGVIED